MYKYSKDGVSVLTVLDKRKQKKKRIVPDKSTSYLQQKAEILFYRARGFCHGLGKTAIRQKP